MSAFSKSSVAANVSPPIASNETPTYIKVLYIVLNVVSVCAIVFANKLVFAVYKFKFVTTLTLIHTIFTWMGMLLLEHLGFFESKKFSQRQLAPLALGYIGYIVLNNLSLNLNTVGLYQLLKITIAPTVIALEFLMFRKTQSFRILLSVLVVCVGVAVAAVTDKVAISNVIGMLVGLTSVVVTGLYQIWVGSKQKELQANSSQLLLAYTPQAMCFLVVLSPLLDDFGVPEAGPDTVLGYRYTPGAVAAIAISGMLGVLVSLSTFLVIGATSSLTYNIAGHIKTVLILTGGCLIFGEAMPWKRLLGILVTMAGIAWYTYLTMQQLKQGKSEAGGGGGSQQGLLGKGEDAEPLLQQAQREQKA
ncbi:hypothetical protein PLESTM_001860200 [Pleodorina starrii]|nr:hypothetical protein PLESTM_001860200 [Pleodorina starrii]